ncbi:alpha/beta hydrolase [Micromonospora auratinigra]|uniref:Enterochelin esterase n=1 Tax=Micromonospora auratinigra TaxID=261654 RepID=A0A1A8Z5A8_9ACTN|nr:alpha/beta hydrolase-fold protein [Micromonospora auratinigra]SBT38989.1 Enterochelin esterase [Micromonospora auratinigra]
MGLTSTAFFTVVCVLAVGMLALAVLDKPRPRRADLQLLTRAARVVGVSALAVLVCGLTLNNQYLFYTSWTDLLGPSDHPTTHRIGDVAAAQPPHLSGTVLAGRQPPGRLPALPAPGQRLQRYTVPSPDVGGTAQVLVELPAGYDPADVRSYPVVVGLHGFPSSPDSYVRTGILSAQDRLVSQHLLGPSIVVIPQINVPRSLDTECVNGGPGQPQIDSWLSNDLPRWIVAHFRVRTDRLSWATVGYSFGGWCAVSLGLRHPGLFGAAVVFQGYFRPDFGTHYIPAASDVAQYDLVRLESRHPVPLSMWVMTSRQDTLSYPSTAQFLRVARSPTAVTATVLPRGGHRNAVWQPLVTSALTWLGSTLPGFHA